MPVSGKEIYRKVQAGLQFDFVCRSLAAMQHSTSLLNFAGFAAAWLLVVGWCIYRAYRRGGGMGKVLSKALTSVGLAVGLQFFIRKKLDSLTGDLTNDAGLVLMIVGAVIFGGLALSAMWLQEISELVAAPLANIFDGGSEPPDPPPPKEKATSTEALVLMAKADEMEPDQAASAYVQFLADNPHETAVREKLAVLYARQFKRLDMATLEFEQLIREPDQPPRQIARWLKLLAKMQIEFHADIATVEATFKRVEEISPDDEEVIAARQRIVRVQQPTAKN
jgi:hypothetical protein